MDARCHLQGYMYSIHRYVAKKYGEAIIGYSESSTKDMVHQRRAKGHASVTVTFTEDMKLSMKKANFLANSVNKQQFIDMLGSYLQKKCKVYHASGDADVLIVQKTVESARVVDTVLVGDDTELLVLLCYHASLHSHNIFLKPEPKNAKNHRVWNITAVKQQLSPEVCSNILFLQVILGCDTTSQLYGIGKATSLKKFKSSRHFQEQAKCFATELATLEDISAAVEQVLINVYNGTPGESLDLLRYKCKKWLQILCAFTLKLYNLLQLLQNTIVSVYTSKYRSGKLVVVNFSHLNGAGRRVKENLCQCSLTCHLLQINS